ncbi:MAG: hypothetical protein NC489_27965 [Ruminococcus flavefaciens]|nr:hypothetical protein [Ruminococcus flavefaciens]
MNQDIKTSQEDMEAINVLVREVVKAIRGNTVNCDRTYQSIIKEITPKGYVVLDSTGSERTVSCCIPNLNLRVMQRVWIKEPCGRLADLHIVGIVGK